MINDNLFFSILISHRVVYFPVGIPGGYRTPQLNLTEFFLFIMSNETNKKTGSLFGKIVYGGAAGLIGATLIMPLVCFSSGLLKNVVNFD